MRFYLVLAATALIASNRATAQETDQQPLEIARTPVVSKETRIAREKQDAKFAKEQRKLQRRQDKLAKQQKKFEKQQKRLAKAEKKLAKERARRDKYQAKLDSETLKYSKRLTQGKMTPEETEKWEAKKRGLEKDISKSIKRMEDADKKVRSLRK